MREARLFIGGAWTDGEATAVLHDKFDGLPLAQVHQPSREQVGAATRLLAAAQGEILLPPPERFTILARASELLDRRRDKVVDAIVSDTGFTLGDADLEVRRGIDTLLLCGEEAKRIHGEVVPLDGAVSGTGRIAFTTRHPLGVVCAITPFNSPLNTVLHKVGPALASGNAVVLKPSAYTPLTANLLVEILLDAGLPPTLISLLHGEGGTVGQWLLGDPVPAFYAFTGSTAVGLQIRTSIGLRRAQLELGSLSSTIVCEDADLDRALSRVVSSAFRKAGQVCTSIQRLYVHEGVYDQFLDAMVHEVGGRRSGDPRDPTTFVGPVISARAADRIEDRIEEAVGKGAAVLQGGGRSANVVEPTILADVDTSMRVMNEEIFGPVVCLRPFVDLAEASREINDTPFGLAVGVFTADLGRALDAAKELRMGAVHVNETSSSRVDLMPYSGVKASGVGREGPRYAIEEMTEERLITISHP